MIWIIVNYLLAICLSGIFATCSNIKYPHMIATPVNCANGAGVIYNVHQNHFNNAAKDVYEVCMSSSSQGPIYSRHTLEGKQRRTSAGNHRPFWRIGLPNKWNVKEPPYKRIPQTIQFADINECGDYFKDVSGSCLIRGHMAPDRDFTDGADKSATYLYENTVPKFQTVNNRNWQKVEKHVQRLADRVDPNTRSLKSLQIVTGGFGQLQLKSTAGATIDINLGDVKAPKFIYKLVRDVAQDKGVVFITVNNHMADPAFVGAHMCGPDLCPNGDYKKYEKGYTYCCSVPGFKAALARDYAIILTDNDFKSNNGNLDIN